MSKKTLPWLIRKDRKSKKNILAPRKRYLICTEGKTEALYFRHYKCTTGPLVVVIDKSDSKVNLVKKTIKEIDKCIQKEEFNKEIDVSWVVLDRDITPLNTHDKSQFIEALSLAKKHNINVAYSNDAFELWFLLHYQDLGSSTHRDQLDKKLEEHLKRKYEKPEDLYKEIKDLRNMALKRAHKLLNSTSPKGGNPSTTVHVLVEKLMNEPGYREEE